MRRAKKSWTGLITFIVIMTIAATTSGCAELAATAITDARDLHQALRNYAEDVYEARREIRRLCWETFKQRHSALVAEGKYDEANALARANYPGLVSVDLIKSALEKDAPLDQPFGCE